MIDPGRRGFAPAVFAITVCCGGWAAAGSPELTVVLDNLPATLFSITGAPHSGGAGPAFDIFAVGAESPDGRGPLLLRYDGSAWQRLAAGAGGDLWWISDRLVDGRLYLGGSDGLILRLDPATLLTEREKGPGGITLYGIWGTDPDNLWAVGGNPASPSKSGVVLRRAPSGWAADPRVADALPGGLPALYKIWGRSATEIYAVGMNGTALHFDGARWSVITTGTTASLFTVAGDAALVIATGGFFEGLILELEGSSFTDHAPAGVQQINGVSVRNGAAAAVGLDGAFYRRGEQGWEIGAAAHGARPLDFHAAWIDPDGGVWAVGGDLTIDRSYGAVAYAGAARIGHDLATSLPCEPAGAGAGGTVSFARDVLPLFHRTGCLNSGCHGAAQPASSYDLRSYQPIFGSGSQAFNLRTCDLTPGDPSASYLIEKLGPSPRVGIQMPTNLPPLTTADLQILRTWILEGARDDTPPSRHFSRGDFNGDGHLDVSDAVSALSFLFLGDQALNCEKAGDADDDGQLNISDPINLLGFQFLGQPSSLPAPFPACGAEPMASDLTCDLSACP